MIHTVLQLQGFFIFFKKKKINNFRVLRYGRFDFPPFSISYLFTHQNPHGSARVHCCVVLRGREEEERANCVALSGATTNINDVIFYWARPLYFIVLNGLSVLHGPFNCC